MKKIRSIVPAIAALGVAAAAVGIAGATANASTAVPAHSVKAVSASWGDDEGVWANEQTVVTFIQNVLNEHHDAIPYFTTDAQWYGGTVGTVAGGSNVGGLFDEVTSALPDLHANLVDIFGQGDQVVVHVVVSGTQEKAILGIAASDRQLKWDGVDIFQVSDHKIAHITAGDDWTAILHDSGTYTAPWIS